MCGIFGYFGDKNASEVILQGLKRLEYRGYDSWGIAVLANQITLSKKVGAIGDLNQLAGYPKSQVGIGHTRWATTGVVSDINAHPHYSSDKGFCLAQNGIMENYQQIKNELIKKGYKFESDTDTEVIVRAIEDRLKEIRKISRSARNDNGGGDLKEAARQVFLELEGRNTIIILTRDGEIVSLRNGSPLVVGLNEKEVFFSSDTLSFAPHVKDVVVIDNGQMVYWDGKLHLVDIKSNRTLPYKSEKINFESSKIDKEGYDHFMLKEISESPYVINQVLSRDVKLDEGFIKAIKKARNIYTIGSGTAGIAASQIAFYLRLFAQVKAQSVIGADIYEYLNLLIKDDLMIAPSQSGETADVLEVLEVAGKKGVKIASYVNMPGSTMARISDFSFPALAGPEICVMSTKVFTSQIAWGYLLAKIISGKAEEGKSNLKKLSEAIDQYLNTGSNHEAIKTLAKILAKSKDIFLLGKYQNFNIVKEGMVKIIEGSYLHAHGIPAGDLKHYAITLMEKGVPVIVVVSKDAARGDMLNAVSQVKARGATVIGISPAAYSGFDYYLPVPDTGETAAIMNIIPLQLLAYYMAVELGHNVDKPRNIAKSVTVK
ncbi:glutamine--fructose-6-phosphate transaminase (isomerizing) [Candidatus Daviesbacteria bacterium]|nr:glutamine--fructose-6-phosphate transaminase (isomerizing) [Candidatus Daviesbacteria bacterium]